MNFRKKIFLFTLIFLSFCKLYSQGKTAALLEAINITGEFTDKFLELQFALLDFDDLSQHNYAYQIEGYSNQWTYIEENYVRITRLPYGDYRLRIKDRNIGKGWSKQELFLDIKVTKPFYLQTWFIGSGIVSLIGLIIGGMKWCLQSLEKDKDLLINEVKKRTTTIQQQAQKLQALDKVKTRFFSNIIHEFSTPLILAIGPLEEVMETELPEENKDKLKNVLKNTRHLLGLINQLLDLPKLENGQMKVEVTPGDINAYQEGTEIGLSLVKELVELQDGSIEVVSEQQKETTFDIRLSAYELSKVFETDILPIIGIESLSQLPISKEKIVPIKDPIPSKPQEQLVILIIEDNTEMRAYIRDCLDETKYHITEVSNGIEGIDKAIELMPDLIISDVMIPGKNGFEVTKTLRSTMSTSHIPIILLTAKSALESRLAGFQSGADAYLTKPFSPQELSLRIQKLIEIRELIKNSVRSIIAVNKTKPIISEIKPPYEQENHFVKKVHAIIEKHLNLIGLNGEFIGEQIGMSRMQVHRKLRALINQSTSELIREIRLQKAYELLQTQNYNSSEVAYQTGFNTLAYFSKNFKEKYGFSPSDLVKKETV